MDKNLVQADLLYFIEKAIKMNSAPHMVTVLNQIHTIVLAVTNWDLNKSTIDIDHTLKLPTLEELISVQPMTAPTGMIFCLSAKDKSNRTKVHDPIEAYDRAMKNV